VKLPVFARDINGAEVKRCTLTVNTDPLDLSDRALERYLFAGAREAMPQDFFATMARHKLEEDAPNYAVVRAALDLLPRRDISVLDVGSGRGRVLLCGALRGARVTGIEILPARAAMAREAATRLGLSNVTIVEGDALKLPWPKTEAVIAMNPFYPTAWRRVRARLLACEHRPVIVAVSTLRDRLAADKRFRPRGEAAVGWIRLGAFELT
jgi:SAM-dependent methyltransferase